jgi:hypothetical protein
VSLRVLRYLAPKGFPAIRYLLFIITRPLIPLLRPDSGRSNTGRAQRYQMRDSASAAERCERCSREGRLALVGEPRSWLWSLV